MPACAIVLLTLMDLYRILNCQRKASEEAGFLCSLSWDSCGVVGRIEGGGSKPPSLCSNRGACECVRVHQPPNPLSIKQTNAPCLAKS